ncbi:hypothetical protein [Sphingomonas sp. PB1R3]|uniref:hypothetical protein n=1 Tax=Sphingomonas flavida TaxID=3096154 RepID=UPI002FC5FDCD
MAITLKSGLSDAMELEDFMEVVSSILNPYDVSSIEYCSKYLYALSLNKNIFDSIILDALKRHASSRGLQEAFNGYREMTFLLDRCRHGNFFVRANVWKPPRAVAGNLDLQNDIYSYNLAHDHNFDFLTVGYFGPGYKTSIYEYDHTKVQGRIGEHVELKHLEDTTLPVGKVMMYRKSVDVHTQLPPGDTSISINLMVQPPRPEYREQYCFDVAQSKIAGYVDGPVSYQCSLLSMAACLGAEDLIEPLFAIAKKSISGRTRARAITAILNISPHLSNKVLSACGTDKNPFVISCLEKDIYSSASGSEALSV